MNPRRARQCQPRKGLLTILDANNNVVDTTPTVGQVLRVSAAGITDADNVTLTNPTGAITGPVTFVWQVEARAGPPASLPISRPSPRGARPSRAPASGPTLTVGADLAGLSIRAMAIYADSRGVLEMASLRGDRAGHRFRPGGGGHHRRHHGAGA